eukprot:TRINITY_DN3539_c0_g1_i4.p1 TRINITY_DN3539_c0_g1~~TRINITY_DN3539_c0_g1_i4.p1  ORF type:complete len:182 (-),score=64.05 TRINITY_DN3539_c0_g1_i4:236-721(-)
MAALPNEPKISSSSKITPFLWFNGTCMQAAEFYTSIFRNSSISSVQKNGDAVFSCTFNLEGQDFMALNGGPMFSFTPAVSFFISCEDQAEIDYFWEALLRDGGVPNRCGWLTDKFGVTWQVIPRCLGNLLHQADPVKAKAVRDAMMAMQKIEIAELEEASS